MRGLQTKHGTGLLVGLCCMSVAAFGRTACAQSPTGPAFIQVFQPSIINPSGKFAGDDEIKFGLRGDLNTWLTVATAHAFRASHRASSDEREPDSWEPQGAAAPSGDDCLIYDAVSIPAKECNNGHELCLGRAGHMYGEWVEGATYLLVFDKSPMTVSKIYEHQDHHQFIGIRKGDQQAYFEHAIPIEIVAADSEQPRHEDVGDHEDRAARIRLGDLQAELKSPDWTKERCFEVKYIQKDNMNIAYLRPCDKNDS